jgi:hypothetical protein
MNPRLLVPVLAVGAVLGFASGFHSLSMRRMHHSDAFERHVARVCVDAAQASQAAGPRGAPPGPF